MENIFKEVKSDLTKTVEDLKILNLIEKKLKIKTRISSTHTSSY